LYVFGSWNLGVIHWCLRLRLSYSSERVWVYKLGREAAMLRILRQFFGPRQAAAPPAEQPETTLVYVRVQSARKFAEETRLDSPSSVADASPAPASVQPPARQLKAAHETRRKPDAKKSLASVGIFSPRQITMLRRIGCRTDRDLLRLTAERLETRLADFASSQQHRAGGPLVPPIDRIGSTVRRGRWAIRFAGRFCDMTPRESLLLHAVHRGSRRTLAQDSAGMIRRDLQRLALSSRGQRMLRLDEIPEVERVKSWIGQARDGCSAIVSADQCPDDGLVNYNQKRFELASEN